MDSMIGVPKALSLKYKSDPMLVLSYLIKEDPSYAELLTEGNFSYLVLDNGGWENRGTSSSADPIESLVEIAMKIPSVKEIILPDVFNDVHETKRKALKALRWLKRKDLLTKWKLMYVVHGVRLRDRTSQVRWIATNPDARAISVVGIPAHELGHSYESDNYTRKTFVQISKLRERYERLRKLEYHILGTPYEIFMTFHLATLYPWIRSIDTTFPVKAAYLNEAICTNTTKDDLYSKPSYKSLSKRYFYLEEPPEDDSLVKYNIGLFRAWASGGRAFYVTRNE